MSRCQLCLAADPHSGAGDLAALLRPGQRPQVGSNPHAVAVPTIGAFTAGYLLIVPRRHALSLGMLPPAERAGVGRLALAAAARLRGVYGRPVLGFEYGLNVRGARRIGHAHLHLLPSDADLAGWVAHRVPGRAVTSLHDLPSDPTRSYITVWDQQGTVTVHPVPNDISPRMRLREVVAQLDSQVSAEDWDWQTHPHPELVRQTVDDLAAAGQHHPVATEAHA